MTSEEKSSSVLPPPHFIWRRLHSLMGLFLVLFLIFHLLTNSQAALLFGHDGEGFITDVNFIHSLPYLYAIEILLLALPFAIHMYWGVRYLFTAESNSNKGDGTVPSLPQYGRNKAYTWQRITSWILLFAVIAHVIQMRFVNYPAHAKLGSSDQWMVRVDADPGVYTVAARLGVQLYDKQQIEEVRQSYEALSQTPRFHEEIDTVPADVAVALQKQRLHQQAKWLEALEARPLQPNQLIAVDSNFATPELLMVRDTFKSITFALLYTFFVLAACFHAFNGLWTAMISWGVTQNPSVQRYSLYVCWGLMALVAFLGLAAIWATYWINLKT